MHASPATAAPRPAAAAAAAPLPPLTPAAPLVAVAEEGGAMVALIACTSHSKQPL